MQLNNLPQTIYCERGVDSAFWAEPINALTNLTFLILGFFSYKLLKRSKITSKKLLALPWLLSLVGIGSFLYHTERNPITLLFDSIPIYTFILYSLFLTLEALFESKIKALIIITGFVLIEVLLSMYISREFMNGSIRHITAIVFIMGIGWLLVQRYGKNVVKPLIGVIGAYAVAIFFRTLDASICEIISFGTHFLWHIGAAIAGYFGIILLLKMKTT